jgi:Asp-tRNA(Asn)/Glu-tRNA(Gln) amidotransferase A subunit family amidase
MGAIVEALDAGAAQETEFMKIAQWFQEKWINRVRQFGLRASFAQAMRAAFDYLNAGIPELRKAKGVTNYRSERFVPAVEYLQANRIRTRIIREMEEAMSGIDAYITPTFVGPTNWLTNLTGHPEMIVPCGFLKENSPASISFVGKLFGEAVILALARTYQSVTDFHLRHPLL